MGTVASGNSVDKFLYLPGDDILTALQREEVVEDETQEEGFGYSGVARPQEVLGNHHLVFVTLPCGREEPPPLIRRLAVRVQAEDWGNRGCRMGEYLEGRNGPLGAFFSGKMAIMCTNCRRGLHTLRSKIHIPVKPSNAKKNWEIRSTSSAKTTKIVAH